MPTEQHPVVTEAEARGGIPAVLYKYLSLEEDIHVERVCQIIDGTMYAAQRHEFNDPFDCAPALRVISDPKLRELHLKDFAERYTGGGSRKERRALVAKGKSRVRKFGFETLARNAVENSLNDARVVCLTTRSNDLLMWGHYAVNHRGCCLRLNFDNLDAMRTTGHVPLPVNYEENRPVLEFPNVRGNEAIEHCFLTKAKCWEYESEWRIIEQDRRRLLHFWPRFVTGVIFGARTKPERMAAVRAHIGKRGMEFFQAKLDAQNYSVDLLEVA